MEEIFIQIASYRDDDLPNTIDSALQNARHPERLTFGVCWQYDETTLTDLDHVLSDRRFRIAQYYYEESLGCCWARNQTNKLYDGEAYTLQIDAHTRFAPAWDARFIEMLASLDSEKPVLSTYPAPFTEGRDGIELATDRGIQRLALQKLHKDLTTTLRGEKVHETDRCVSNQFLAAGQIFTLGPFCREVEYDPLLYFSGEEISLAARAFTHGYDFFVPNEDLLWHRYKHSMPMHWGDHRETRHKGAMERLQTLFVGDHTSLGEHGLGFERSISEYERYAGLDFKARLARMPTPMRFSTTIEIDVSSIEDRNDYKFWIFSLRSLDDVEIYRRDIYDPDVLTKKVRELRVDASLEDEPVDYMLWPYVHGRGFQQRHYHDL